MAATTTLLGLVTPTQGTLTGTWGDTVNYGITEYLDIAIAGTLTLTGDGTVILANTTGSSSGTNITSTLSGPGTVTAQFAIVKVSGTTGVKIVQAPSFSRTYLVVNASSFAVTFKPSSASGVSIAAGETASVYYNGADYVKVVGTATAGAAGGSNTQVQYNNSGVLAGITGATSNGTALTLVAPNLGSPFSVGTMPAFTLGGTIAGGGNQINNVVIGTTTPLAGAFTTLSATGAITGTTIALSGQTADITNATLALLTLKTTDNGGLSAVKLDGKTGGAAVQAWIVGLNRSGTAGTFDIEDATASTFALTITRATLAAKFGGTLSGGTSGTAYSFSGSAPATSLTLDSSGNLGIGTSSPGAKLHVSGTGTVVQKLATNSGAVEFQLIANSQSNASYSNIYSGDGTNWNWVIGGSNGTSNTMTFSTGGSERARIDSSGNLGLGVTPSAWYTSFGTKAFQFAASGALYGLDVSSSDRRVGMSNNSFINTSGNNIYLNTGAATQYQQTAGQHQWYNAASGTAGDPITFTQAMTLDASGNLGIATTTPATYGAFAVRKAVTTADTTNCSASFSDAANSTFDIGHPSANLVRLNAQGSAIAFNAGSSERARIDSSGNLLVGTTSALSQAGIATFVSTGNGLVTQVGNSSTAYQSTNTSGTSAYYAAIFSNNGNTFSTCGTIQVSGTTTSYNTASDYRLKEDVQPMTGALAKVAQLKPVTYKWKFDGTDSEGFIAHELAEVCPQAVSGEKDALKEDGSIMPQGIDTSFLVATLTAAIQEQQALITQLTARITALEKP